MDKEGLSPELEQLLRKVRVKEPPQELMADFAKGVNERIDRGAERHRFGFPQAMMVMAVGLAFAGAVYFLVARAPARLEEKLVLKSETASRPEARPSVTEALSVEEEAAIVEELDEESLGELIEAMGDEELLDEIDFMDSLEFAASKAAF